MKSVTEKDQTGEGQGLLNSVAQTSENLWPEQGSVRDCGEIRSKINIAIMGATVLSISREFLCSYYEQLWRGSKSVTFKPAS
jgi:hypothetical protein